MPPRARCLECGGRTLWDDDAGSNICTACGTLVDSSQSVLTSTNLAPEHSAGQSNLLWDPASSSTLKSVRNGGWDLAGQGKEARDRRNTYAMHEFIRSILSRLSAPGLAPRATNLFSQAMAGGRHRWGRKAKLIAGASIAVALRESHRSDSIRDIAFFLDEPAVCLSRVFTSTVKLLNLVLTSSNPGVHLDTLQAHYSSLLKSSDQPVELPVVLLDALRQISLVTAMRTAKSLADLLTCLGESSPLEKLPTPPSACAILMLSLEAEAQTSLPHLTDFSDALGARFSVGKSAVLMRYKLISDTVEEWIREVPWLGQYCSNTKGKNKLTKRVIVARGLKDVLQFQEEIWRKKIESLDRPELTLEIEDEDRSTGGPNTTSTTRSSPNQDPSLPVQRRKKRKTHHALDDASMFLLSPLTALSVKRVPEPLPASSNSLSTAGSSPPRSRRPPIALTSYLLSVSPAALSLTAAPTRLQLLAVARGGEDSVHDEDLFEVGELDDLVRSEEEVERLRVLWDWDKLDVAAEEHKGNNIPSRTAKSQEKESNGSKRVDMDALARLLGGPSEQDESMNSLFQECAGYVGEADSDHGSGEEQEESTMSMPHLEEDIAEWHVMSPCGDPDDRYDQEYE